MGNEKRWLKPISTPGVGDYDLTGFQTLSKASESGFGPRRKSNQSNKMKSDKSKSPDYAHSVFKQRGAIPSGKKLGGP